MNPKLLGLRQERARLLAEELSKETGIPVDGILGQARDRAIVEVRHRMWAALFEAGLTTVDIGKVVDRHHVSIAYGIKRHIGTSAYARLVCERSYTSRSEFPERFWRRTLPHGDCLDWTGSKKRHGYGQLRWDGRLQLAHRVAWQLTNGPITDAQVICHRCDRPSCVRPEHLFLGTQADNVADMVAKGRARGPQLLGLANPNGKFPDATVELVRDLARQGMSRADICRRVRASKSWVAYVIRGVRLRGRARRSA